MSASPTKQIDARPALRHVVYRELLCHLPPASIGQTVQIIVNLRLYHNEFLKLPVEEPIECGPGRSYVDLLSNYDRLWGDVDRRDAAFDRVLGNFLYLKVTPDIATATNYRKLTKAEIEQMLDRKFGDRLAAVAGFYKTSRWRVNLPENCALHGYKSRLGFYTGIVCLPLDSIDMYFVLSSAKFGGAKAVRMEESDREYFEQFKEPIPGPPSPFKEPLDLSNYEIRGSGRNIRFVERKPKRSEEVAL